LAIDKERHVVRSVSQNVPALQTEVKIDAAPPSVHLEIAREFVRDTSYAEDAAILSILNSGSESWWKAWSNAMRSRGQMHSWNAFRRTKLEEQLLAALTRAGLPTVTATTVLQHILQAKQKRPSERSELASPSTSRVLETLAVREVVMAVVQGLDSDELRALRLPVGVVVDVIRRRLGGSSDLTK
jgi:hypothetical protein